MKFFRKSDIIIIAVLLVGSVLGWFIYQAVFKKQAAKAEIYYYSELAKTIELDTGAEKIFSISQDPHVIFHLYPDGSIRFEESDCPDKICINAGKLQMAGQNAACLPNGIVLKIVPKGKAREEDLDIIVR